MRKVKTTFDPENLAIDYDFISPKEPDLAIKAWPVLSPFLFSKVGKPLLKMQIDQACKTKTKTKTKK